MKKILSMAIIAMMVALAAISCDKKGTDKNSPVTPTDPEETTVYPVMDAFNIGKDLVGRSHNDVVAALLAKGFSDKGGVIKYEGKSYTIEMTDSANNEGTVFNLSLTVAPYNDQTGDYKPVLTMSAAYHAIQNIGTKFTMGSDSIRYYGTYNRVGTRMASSCEEFEKYMKAENFDQSKSVWIELSIPYYDAANWNGFIGLQMLSSKTDVPGSTETEFSFSLSFIDNRLKD